MHTRFSILTLLHYNTFHIQNLPYILIQLSDSKKINFYIENLIGLLYYVQRLLSKRREGGFYETLDEST